MASKLARELLDSGIHFGHRASRLNPKMAPYIYGKRNKVHIIDIRETVKGLLRAKEFISRVVASGRDVLLVGTKRRARILVKDHARRIGMPYVAERWLGGTLTNFRTIRSRLTRMEELEREAADGTLALYSKKAIATRTRELRKIQRNLQGIRNMEKLPGAIVVIDVQCERIAVKEARTLRIPTVCLIDTDSDPDLADIPIPGNDDSIRSIALILEHISEAIESGKKARTIAAEGHPAFRGPVSSRRRADAPERDTHTLSRHVMVTDDIDLDFVVVWDPVVLNASDYADLIVALGDVVRSEGAVGLKRLDGRSYGVLSSVEVLV